MTNYKYTVFLSFCILILSTCYLDDSSQPNPTRIEFEDFQQFFDENNVLADTFMVDANQETLITSNKGVKIKIPENAFNTTENIFLEVKEGLSKSDFIFLDRPSLEGDNLIESSGAIFIKPFKDGTPLNIDHAVEIELPLPNGTTAENMQFYHFQNTWNLDNSIDILSDGNTILFDTKRAAWQMGGKPFDGNDKAQLRIQANGYGTVPHDMRAYVVFSDYNMVMPLDHDLSTVTASGLIPKGTEIEVVVMVMDHFILTVGIETLTINDDTEIVVNVLRSTVDEMITSIKSLD